MGNDRENDGFYPFGGIKSIFLSIRGGDIWVVQSNFLSDLWVKILMRFSIKKSIKKINKKEGKRGHSFQVIIQAPRRFVPMRDSKIVYIKPHNRTIQTDIKISSREKASHFWDKKGVFYRLF